jgi:hypothetical protein
MIYETLTDRKHLKVQQTSIIKQGKGKGKAIPSQTWTGLEGSTTLNLPDFKTIGT